VEEASFYLQQLIERWWWLHVGRNGRFYDFSMTPRLFDHYVIFSSIINIHWEQTILKERSICRHESVFRH
jgi:hypothetical protein